MRLDQSGVQSVEHPAMRVVGRRLHHRSRRAIKDCLRLSRQQEATYCPASEQATDLSRQLMAHVNRAVGLKNFRMIDASAIARTALREPELQPPPHLTDRASTLR